MDQDEGLNDSICSYICLCFISLEGIGINILFNSFLYSFIIIFFWYFQILISGFYYLALIYYTKTSIFK